MRYRDLYASTETLTEMPIQNWDVSDNFDANEKEMVSKWHGYENEKPHWTDKDKEVLRSPEHIQKIKDVFTRCPHEFNLFFWQGPDPDYDPYLQEGEVDDEFIRRCMGDDAERIIALRGTNAITILMTNNLSDERHIPIQSPWMVAHRIAHALEGFHGKLSYVFRDFIRRLLTTGYGVKWPNEDSNHGRIFAKDYYEIYGKILGTKIGTMKAARHDKFVQMNEWPMETFAQYIVQGRVTTNPLPASLDDAVVLTTNPAKLALAQKTFNNFPKQIARHFESILKNGCGKIFVI